MFYRGVNISMENELFALEAKKIIEGMIGSYGWFILVGFAAVFLKESLNKAVEGFVIFMGKDFQNDDVIYISGRQARIVRVGLFKTIFYMTDRKTKMVVPNDRLKTLIVEKLLPQNRDLAYLFKGSEAGYRDQKEKVKKEE
jgi:hypothetical protein